MIFQWVDCPSYGRSHAHQHHYAQAPAVPPYYQGVEVPAPYGAEQLRAPDYGASHHQAHGLGAGGWGGLGQSQETPDVGRGYGRPPKEGPPGAPGGARRRMDGGSAAPHGGAPQRAGRVQQEAAMPDAAGGHPQVREALHQALDSIYRDRIKPMANYVKGRLKERACPDALVKNFLEHYARHSDLFVVQQPPPPEEASIFFLKEPAWFKGWVDIDSPSDPYEEGMWDDLAKFLDDQHTFAGGRYGMARELMQRQLAFLQPYSLGEICHIVQLAIQQRKLIVYHRKMLKPVQSIMCQQPNVANGTGGTAEGEITDMDHLCLLLFRMLMRHPQGVQLSRMKQMIKREFGSAISEMAFQCTKLSELFLRDPLKGTFLLEVEDAGKSMYVRVGDQASFSEHVKRIYAKASTAEAKLVRQ